MTTTTTPRRNGEQLHDAVEAIREDSSNGLDEQDPPRCPRARVGTRRLITLRQAAGVAAAGAALTMAIIVVIPDRDAVPSLESGTRTAEVAVNQGQFGSADAVERWLSVGSQRSAISNASSAGGRDG
jgi:hypothetical protein